jgi:hypothetical protein
MMKLFIVGKVVKRLDEGAVWEFQGVFGDKKLAERQCIDENWFVGPVNLDEELPDSKTDWPDGYYPKQIEPFK